MATSSTVTITSDIAYSVVDQTDTNNINRYNNSLQYSLVYNHGTGVPSSGITNSQVNLYVKSSGTLSGNSVQPIDFTNYNKVTLGIPYTYEFHELKGLVIENMSSGTGEILYLTATGSNAFTNIFNGGTGNLAINPYGSYMYTDMYGTDVTASNKLLYIENRTSTGIPYALIAVGVNTGIASEDESISLP